MTKISFTLKNKFIFFRRVSVEDDKGSRYLAWYSIEGDGLYLERNGKPVFKGDVYDKTFCNKNAVKCSQRYAPKDFLFQDGNFLNFSGYTKTGNVRCATLVLNGNVCAKVSCENFWGGLQEKYIIEVDSDDEIVLDMVLFAFMHEFNWEHIYVGT